MTTSEAHRLSLWEEGAFRLREIAEDEAGLIAIGDKVRFRLSLELRTV